MTIPNGGTPHKLAYSINEAIEATSIKRTKLYELLADPDCPLTAIRVGGRTLVTAESLHALIYGAEEADV